MVPPRVRFGAISSASPYVLLVIASILQTSGLAEGRLDGELPVRLTEEDCKYKFERDRELSRRWLALVGSAGVERLLSRILAQQQRRLQRLGI